MNCHLNVKTIKFVLKFVHKGSDQATFQMADPSSIDKVSDYISARYIGSNEAERIIIQMSLEGRY